MQPSPRLVATLGLVPLLASLAACASLRQNVRGQELSYRGAWHCADGPCSAAEMVRSTSGMRDGTVNINTVKLEPKAAMAFTAAAPFDSLTATASDCKGQQVELAPDSIAKPGTHGVEASEAHESWVVWVNPSELVDLERGSGACAIWKIEATATWSDGATYSLTAGVQIEG